METEITCKYDRCKITKCNPISTKKSIKIVIKISVPFCQKTKYHCVPFNLKRHKTCFRKGQIRTVVDR